MKGADRTESDRAVRGAEAPDGRRAGGGDAGVCGRRGSGARLRLLRHRRADAVDGHCGVLRQGRAASVHAGRAA